MSAPTFESASGLRPFSAFVLVGGVVAAVALRVGTVALAGTPLERPALEHEVATEPVHQILDRNGRPLARCVRRLDLVFSPRAMWQAHTPDRMAQALSKVLGGEPSEEELLEKLLPDAREGRVTAELSLSARQALALSDWVESEGLPGLEAVRDGTRWGLRWEPALLLSETTREAHGYLRSPLGWTRHLADRMAALFWGELPELGPAEKAHAIDQRRERIWRALTPSADAVALAGVPVERGQALVDLLREEGVAPHQMRLDLESDRLYPTGE